MQKHHFANFLGVVLILRPFFTLKEETAFSCYILLSRVTPRSRGAMPWQSPDMNFPRHPRVTKLLCDGSPLKGSFTIFLFSVRTHILDSNEVWYS